MNRRVLTKTVVLIALAIAFGRVPTVSADEYPSDGGCTGQWDSSSSGTHCCLYNTCGVWWQPWNNNRDNGYVVDTYVNPGCTQVTHTGSPGGCC